MKKDKCELFWETTKAILVIVLIVITAYVFLFGIISFSENYVEKKVKDSNFCQNLNMSFHAVVDNGYGSSKIICLDNNNERHEYYYEEAFK